jgi:methionyl aminopeptidase
MIKIKNDKEIESMRIAGSIANTVLKEAAAFISPGLTTKQIDDYAGERIAAYQAKSAFLGYRDYPCNICISVNEEVVHGLAGPRRIQFGDIISLDVGICYDGYIGDNALTVAVGGCDPLSQKLMDVTETSLYEGIAAARVGNRVADISRAIQKYVEANSFSIVREFVGHGVGKTVHEDPQVPNFVERGRSTPKLKAGMTIAIEPMVNAGTARVKVLGDGWTVLTQDGLPSAHFEHTVLVTKDAPEILTCSEKIPSSLKVS